MQTEATLRVRADAATMYGLVAAVEAWPRLLPHYRRVTVLRDDGQRRVVEMRARRDLIPVAWTAEQRLFPSEPRVAFTHVGGITRGMQVSWTFVAQADGTLLVRVWHWFCPAWPLVPDWLVHLVIGRFFVDAIAGRTLACLAREAGR
jgi:ribosome-associated toxin RatA of RatAB toxin-antitoxin module